MNKLFGIEHWIAIADGIIWNQFSNEAPASTDVQVDYVLYLSRLGSDGGRASWTSSRTEAREQTISKVGQGMKKLFSSSLNIFIHFPWRRSFSLIKFGFSLIELLAWPLRRTFLLLLPHHHLSSPIFIKKRIQMRRQWRGSCASPAPRPSMNSKWQDRELPRPPLASSRSQGAENQDDDDDNEDEQAE